MSGGLFIMKSESMAKVQDYLSSKPFKLAKIQDYQVEEDTFLYLKDLILVQDREAVNTLFTYLHM